MPRPVCTDQYESVRSDQLHTRFAFSAKVLSGRKELLSKTYREPIAIVTVFNSV
jgi:hypothetical protein